MTINFVSAASTTGALDAVATQIALPAVDAGNVDMIVRNPTGLTAWVAFGAGARVEPETYGVVSIPPGVTVLLTQNATTLAAGNTNPLVKSAISGVYATTTVAMVVAPQKGGSLVFTRGTASPTVVF